MVNRRLLMGIGIGVGLAAAGCQRTPMVRPPFGVSNDYQVLPGQPGPGLVADPGSPIPDVPRPIGFKPLVGLSSLGPTGVGGARRVHHVYQGMGSAGEAVWFYRQQLRSRGWEPTGMRGGDSANGGADVVLGYRKGPEELMIGIVGKGNVTTLIVDIAPAGTLGMR